MHMLGWFYLLWMDMKLDGVVYMVTSDITFYVVLLTFHIYSNTVHLSCHRCVQPCLPLPLHQPMAQNPPSVPTWYALEDSYHLFFKLLYDIPQITQPFTFNHLQIIVSGSSRSMATKIDGSKQNSWIDFL